MSKIKLMLGDCLKQMGKLPANSVDSIVTDPPYGLSFMGKKWDYDVPSVEIWREALRVLKPGGHLLAFGGTRTYHRLVVNIEDAGFEIRDQLQWIYGSGFPKSQDVSKAIDKQAGAKREVIGKKPKINRPNAINQAWAQKSNNGAGLVGNKLTLGIGDLTAPATQAAKTWAGFGTALKPANEPICLARKPLEKGLTVASNVLKYGTGALNIDGSRIEGEAWKAHTATGLAKKKFFTSGEAKEIEKQPHMQGRWPANVLFDEDAASVLDAQSGQLAGGGARKGQNNVNSLGERVFGKYEFTGGKAPARHSGGASRFFYVAKSSKRERNQGVELSESVRSDYRPNDDGTKGIQSRLHGATEKSGNFHPTVKPVKLMEYLVRLITPPQGVCLDPFMGSGTTGVAAKNLGFDFIGCELSPDYLKIARARIKGAKKEKPERPREEQLELASL